MQGFKQCLHIQHFFHQLNGIFVGFQSTGGNQRQQKGFRRAGFLLKNDEFVSQVFRIGLGNGIWGWGEFDLTYINDPVGAVN